MPPHAKLSPLRRGVLLATNLCLVALFLEGATRSLLLSDGFFARIASPYDETSWRLSWLRRHRGDQAAYRFSFDQHHPVRGWTLAPNLRELAVFDGKVLNSNSRGLRGTREFTVPKPAGTFRIAIFGDSFTFGEDVSDHETFAQQVQRLLPETEVLNFGVHGYGHDQMLLYLREALPIVQPDVVVLGYVTDDSLRNLFGFRDYKKPTFERTSAGLALRGTPVPTPEEFLARERKRSRLLDLVRMAAERAAWNWGDRQAEVDRLTDALLSEFFREARAAGARPAVALLPVWGELGVTDPSPLPGEGFVLSLSAREGVPCLRLRPAFLERARLGAEFERRGHWGALEHRVAAGAIVDFLHREGLIPAG